MGEITKPKALVLRERVQKNSLLEKLESILQKISEFISADATGIKTHADFRKANAELETSTTVFVDLNWIQRNQVEFEDAWKQWRIVLVQGDEVEGINFNTSTWRSHASSLELPNLGNAELVKLLQIAIAPERLPGIFATLDPNAEIYYEKVQRMEEVGVKVDRFMKKVGENFPELSAQYFNLRQLSYAILHQALANSGGIAKLVPTVDFQVGATKDRLIFCATFNAAEGMLQEIREGIAQKKNLLWHNAMLCCDFLVLTELSKKKQFEVKAGVIKGENFSAVASNKTMLTASIPEFKPDAQALASQKQAKMQPMESLPNVKVEGVASAAEEEEKSEEAAQLNYKLKADMLENERSTLQGLVKKKNTLITEMNKDINRAQREVMLTRNNASKELRDMRMEVEKANRNAHLATEKLEKMQKHMEENLAAAGAAASGASAGGAAQANEAKRDYEKEIKQLEYAKRLAEEKSAELTSKNALQEENITKLRRELDQTKAQLNEAKAKAMKMETAAEAKAKSVGQEEKTQAGQDGNLEKIKQLQKLYAEAKSKEQELDKEVKRLQIKVESADQSMKGMQSSSEKKLETTEKLLEESKKRLTEASKRLEEQKEDNKKQIEELKAKELEQKRKADASEKALAEEKKKAEALQKKIDDLSLALKAGLEGKKAS